jgi:hypothetical protein
MTFDGNPKAVQFIQPNVFTVPAFPSVSTTPLPINSDCAAPYSFKIFDARRFTDGITSMFGRTVCADQTA